MEIFRNLNEDLQFNFHASSTASYSYVSGLVFGVDYTLLLSGYKAGVGEQNTSYVSGATGVTCGEYSGGIYYVNIAGANLPAWIHSVDSCVLSVITQAGSDAIVEPIYIRQRLSIEQVAINPTGRASQNAVNIYTDNLTNGVGIDIDTGGDCIRLNSNNKSCINADAQEEALKINTRGSTYSAVKITGVVRGLEISGKTGALITGSVYHGLDIVAPDDYAIRAFGYGGLRLLSTGAYPGLYVDGGDNTGVEINGIGGISVNGKAGLGVDITSSGTHGVAVSGGGAGSSGVYVSGDIGMTLLGQASTGLYCDGYNDGIVSIGSNGHGLYAIGNGTGKSGVKAEGPIGMTISGVNIGANITATDFALKLQSEDDAIQAVSLYGYGIKAEGGQSGIYANGGTNGIDATILNNIYNTVNSNGTKLNTIDTVVDNILVDTGTDIPAQLVAILDDTGNSIPTTLSNIDTKLNTIDNVVDAILVDTGTTIPAQLTTIENNTESIANDTYIVIPDKLNTIESKINTIDTVVDSILVDTGTDIPASITNIDTNISAILTSTSFTIPNKIDQVGNKVDVVDNVVDGIAIETAKIDILDTKLNTIDNIVDNILVDTGTTIPAQILGVETKIDTVDSVADSILIDTTSIVNKLPTGTISNLSLESEVETGHTVRDSLSLASAVADGKFNVNTSTGETTLYKRDNTTILTETVTTSTGRNRK